MMDPHEIERIRLRVEATICPTFSAARGETLEGRISRADFDFLMAYIDYCARLIAPMKAN